MPFDWKQMLQQDLSDDDSDENAEALEPITITSDIFHLLAESGDSVTLRRAIQYNEHKDFSPEEPEVTLEDKDFEDASPLFLAVFHQHLDCARILVDSKASVHSTCEGNSLFHVALSVISTPGNESYRLPVFDFLFSTGLDVNQRNQLGQTPLHLAAYFNDSDSLAILLQHGADGKALDIQGNTALHVAALHGCADAIRSLLRASPESVEVENRQGLTAFAVAIEGGWREAVQILMHFGVSDLSKYLSLASDCGQTTLQTLIQAKIEGKDVPAVLNAQHHGAVVLTSERCCRHRTCAEPPPHFGVSLPPEKLRRLEVLIDPKMNGSLLSHPHAVSIARTNRRAEITDILRVHEWSYVQRVKQKAEQASVNGFASIDADTSLCSGGSAFLVASHDSPDSFETAMTAAGVVLEAVDRVCQKNGSPLSNPVFCVVRPPGHHVGPIGAVENSKGIEPTTGFCLFNNVAVAAAYARSHYDSQGIHRIAIIDIDVHHGNGTEAIVRALNPLIVQRKFTTPMSVFEYSHPLYKPWLNEQDGNNVLFASVHGYGLTKPGQPSSWFYPFSGESLSSLHLSPLAPSNSGSPQMTVLRPRIPASKSLQEPIVIDVPLSLQAENKPLAWHRSWTDHIFPALRQFHPDLILLSSGFDAHSSDGINWGFGGLSEYDYLWFTRRIRAIAYECGHGRIVSILEGGYQVSGRGISALALSAAYHLTGLLEDNRGLPREDELADAVLDAPVVGTQEAACPSDCAKPELRKRKPVDYISSSSPSSASFPDSKGTPRSVER